MLTFDRPLPAGTAVLNITYDAPFDDSLAGLYRVNDGGRWYAYTQFEATDARRAFPCFDEPSFRRSPFDIHITTPKGLVAFSNMPEAGRASTRRRAHQTTRSTSRPARPFPTYLVALAVGDFDVREGADEARSPSASSRRRASRRSATLALEDTAALVVELVVYFGVAYPYPKLDIVAVPELRGGRDGERRASSPSARSSSCSTRRTPRSAPRMAKPRSSRTSSRTSGSAIS